MKLLFCAVGKSHDGYVRDGTDDFTARIQKYFAVQWQIVAPAKNAAALSVAAMKEQEGKNLMACIMADDFVVLLDERGKQLSSPEVALFLQRKANESTKRLVFVIGGAFGVSEELRQRANFVWSLSKLVFPHMLVRLMLAEQVYRACSILRNEKYHHT
jgi:23S rRNA (pseudouridine1915-N3)-methyltransferase